MSSIPWGSLPLKSLTSRIGDGLHGTPKYSGCNGFPFINGNNLKNGFIRITSETKNVSEEEFKKYYIELNENTLLLSINGTLGALAKYRGEKVILGKSAAYIKCIKINIDFLYYYLQLESVQKCMWNIATGSTIKNLSLDSIRNLMVPVPKEGVQKKIASVLSALDAKIELNNRINTELEAMAKTLYDYWFVQFDFPDESGKPYKSSGGKMVYNEVLKRKIPEGWDCICIGDVLDKTPSTRKVPNKEILKDGHFPVIDQSMDYICGFTNDAKACLQVKSAHIIFGDHTRILKIITFDYARGADGTQVLISKLPELPEHLLYQMVKEIDLSNYGYARHFKFLKEKLVIRPNKTISKEYEIVSQKIFRKIRYGLLENQQLAQLRDWLLPMLMNGQVSVG